jgi:hypothetical protein
MTRRFSAGFKKKFGFAVPVDKRAGAVHGCDESATSYLL